MGWRGALAGLAIAGAGLVPGFEAYGATAAGDPVADARPTIDQANSAWADCIKTGDADCIVKPYADDGLFVLPDGKTVQGKAAIRDLYAKRAASGSHITEVTIHSAGAAAGGPDLVYEWGSAEMSVTAKDGTQSQRGGAYLTVWHRAAGGTWQIIRNIVF